MHDINLIDLINLINNVLQPQNSGQLSSTLIEKLENLRENLKHDIIPEHFDKKYFSFDISNPRQMTETERNLT
jgi:predicted outer membrane protein